MFASPIIDTARDRSATAIFAIVLALCALASCSGQGCGSSPPPAQPAPPEVSVLTLRPQPVTVYDEYVARVMAPDTIEIRSQVTGTLQRIAFDEGAFVHRGELLYEIDDRPFVTAVRQAEADVAQAKAQADNARANAARYQALFRRGVVSAQEYDTYATAARTSAAVADSKEALLRDAEINLGYTKIRAPSDGRVNRSLLQPGALVTAQQTLLTTLYAGSSLYVYFAVDQDDVADLTRYTQAEAPAAGKTSEAPTMGEGAPQASAPTFDIVLGEGMVLPTPGRLDFVSPSIEGTTGTLQARLQVPQDPRLLPGQYVRVRVPILHENEGILVPQRAVSELQGLKSVFVVEDGVVHSRSITAEHRVGNDWLVDRGLSAGDTVVVEGTGKVHEGEAVRTVSYTPPSGGE